MPIVSCHTAEHWSLENPALTDPLWRYMGLSKFIAMLVNNGLYMSRIDLLGDEFEGWIPPSPKYGGFSKNQLKERDRKLRKHSTKERKRYYVSCWHMNDDQSDAMWKLYTKGNEGVAIRTTTRDLNNSLEAAPEELWHNKVVYSNSEREPQHGGSMLRACMIKRMPFKHEKETRIVWYNDDKVTDSIPKRNEKTEGFYVKCDLGTLLSQVFIAPTKKPWLGPLVEDLLIKYGIKANVIQSGLYNTPT